MNAKSAVKLFNNLKSDTGHIRALINVKNARIHKTAQVKYPAAKPIPLPGNVEAIITNEIGRFSPQRARDINGPVMISQASHKNEPVCQISHTKNSYEPRVECFDCTGAVSLSSSMQTNVPIPFRSRGKVTHLNMPGGQWEQENKFIADDMQKSHYTNNLNKKKQGTRMLHTLMERSWQTRMFLVRLESTNKSGDKGTNKSAQISTKDKLKKAITEYGSTVVVFHVGISLLSLGTCYILVSSGLDIGQLLTPLGLSDGIMASKVATNAGTFVAAYAIHKVFAPVRISITLGATPFIVRYLRNIGFLKKPQT